MALEDLTGPDVFICNLVRENPEGTDPKSQGDDHIRGIKNVLLNTYPNVCDEAITWTAPQANAIIPALLQLWNQNVGAVAAFPLAIPAGSGYFDCNGQAISRVDFPILFAYLGESYGVGDGVTTFNLPDYRGQFLRGQDAGRGLDPDAAGRTARADGTAGDNPGTTELSANLSHTHPAGGYLGGSHAHGAGSYSVGAQTAISSGAGGGGIDAGGTLPVVGSSAAANSSVTGTSGAGGGVESRPVNINVIYGIKADQQVPIP